MSRQEASAFNLLDHVLCFQADVYWQQEGMAAHPGLPVCHTRVLQQECCSRSAAPGVLHQVITDQGRHQAECPVQA